MITILLTPVKRNIIVVRYRGFHDEIAKLRHHLLDVADNTLIIGLTTFLMFDTIKEGSQIASITAEELVVANVTFLAYFCLLCGVMELKITTVL